MRQIGKPITFVGNQVKLTHRRGVGASTTLFDRITHPCLRSVGAVRDAVIQHSPDFDNIFRARHGTLRLFPVPRSLLPVP
ncbi:hypothetical protein CKA32_005558 [Geitlerinema sp. FC II]|nr:hypothetical protein CKA32_005558 [Geitlerinema sp. FC II]